MATDQSCLWIVAGPNGAGKTTCVQSRPISYLLADVRFINPDAQTLDRLKEMGYAGFAATPPDVQGPIFLECAKAVYDDLSSTLADGGAAGVETVLSTKKYRPLVSDVRGAGGFVGLIYVFLSSPEIAVERVAFRVRRGGHDVPTSKIHARWRRSLDELDWFASQASAFWVFDNSSSDPENAAPLVARGQFGRLEWISAAAHAELNTALSSLPR